MMVHLTIELASAYHQWNAESAPNDHHESNADEPGTKWLKWFVTTHQRCIVRYRHHEDETLFSGRPTKKLSDGGGTSIASPRFIEPPNDRVRRISPDRNEFMRNIYSMHHHHWFVATVSSRRRCKTGSVCVSQSPTATRSTRQPAVTHHGRYRSPPDYSIDNQQLNGPPIATATLYCV
ncbi:Hypothetical predicted protein, partial [Scomber scombrus]